MKKITLYTLLFLSSYLSFSQVFIQNFESSATALPTGWNYYQNAFGATEFWKISNLATTPPSVCQGSNAASIARENIGIGNTSEDYLVTQNFQVPANGQLKFLSRQGTSGDQGSIYQLKLSTNTDPSLLSAYVTLQTWTETQMNTTFNVCQEQVVDLNTYATQNVHLAFVRVGAQTTNATMGDRWFIDNVQVVVKCFEPTLGSSSNIAATTATLTWTNPTGILWDLEIRPTAQAITGVPTNVGVTSTTAGNIKTYQATGLTPNTTYQYYVRNVCDPLNKSLWVGPFNFTTLSLGSVCSDPIQATGLPYQNANTTAAFGDFFDTIQSNNASCGAVPVTTNYLAGNEVFYKYTATITGQINITNTPTGPNSSIFIYPGCPIAGACLAGVANTGSGVRTISNFAVVAGQSYTIVISSALPTQSVGYTLLIQQENCASPVGSIPTVAQTTQTTATLSWTNPSAATSWQVAVQPLGQPVPAGAGTTVGTNPYTATGLNAGTQYQYWVRAECATPGVFSVWAGPYPFNTVICAPADQCVHNFRMFNVGGSGWNGARMEVRQNNIVIATIGSTFTAGSGPITVPVQMCKDVPFDVFWLTAGTQPAQVKLEVNNSFGQTIYTKLQGQGTVGTILYNNTVNCTTPVCTIAPINPTATLITTTTATLGWTAPATTNWDIFIVPFGDPAPTAASLPTYANVTANPFLTTIPLTADTQYTFYVRVVCSPNPSPWSVGKDFTTLPTCIKPTALTVSGITTTAATLGWTNGLPTHNSWEILLVPSPTYTLPTQLPSANPTLGGGTLLIPTTTPSTNTITGLTPATIYFYYIRTVCPGNDKSTWAGPFAFNTVTCDPLTKCTYRFRMYDLGGNGWDSTRMQVRQNGIVVATLGATFQAGAGPSTFGVQLCPGVPFDLFWLTPGANPADVGVDIINPFTDIIYTKIAGQGAAGQILFQSTGNCTPPTCPKPTNLTANTTSTTAVVGWTEMGTATQWEVYAVTVVNGVATIPPVNGAPLGTGVPYYLATTNPYTITGLNPASNYIYYVRALCSTTDRSTWTILNPLSFTTRPLNDECTAAKTVGVNPNKLCTVSETGNTLGAGASAPLNLVGGGCGTSDDDVWFKFTATKTTHLVNLKNIVGTSPNTLLNHTVFSGTCTSLITRYCSTNTTSVATGLVIGQTYFVRVYTANSTPGLSAAFDICITTPPDILNDDCLTATTAVVNAGLECVNVTPGSITGATASSQTLSLLCVGVADDDVWYKFTATAATHYFSLVNVSGTSTNLNHAIYSGDCSSPVLVYCSTANSLVSNNNTFVIGQSYFVRVWSNSNVLQDITFSLCIGKILPPITVSTTQYTTQQLIEDIFLGTTCATVTNITSSTGTNFGSTNGIGYFNKSGSEFPYQEGIILTTGSAINSPGPENSTLSDGNQAWVGDTDLEAIILAATGQPMNSRNATKLEFDFIPIKNQLKLNFLFASEEYGTFQCSFSDSFAFLLTNLTTGVTTNIALIPGTTTPVSVVTIRNSLYNAGCASVNEAFFGSFYGPNGINPLGAPTDYQGVTIPMEALAAVIPGQQYHIKMVIADRSDNSFDSAIFLKGGSFDIGNIDFGADLLASAGNAICLGDCKVLNANIDTNLFNIKWFKDGVLIPGATSSTLNVCLAGVYKIEANFNAFSSCVLSDSITIEYFQDLTAGTPINLTDCIAASSSNFNLAQNTPIILAPYTANHTVSYYTTSADAIANLNPIANPGAYANITNPQTIYVRVLNTITNCLQYSNFVIKVQDLTPIYTLSGNTQVCSNGNTTITVVPTNNNFLTTSPNVTYNWKLNGVTIASATSSSLLINNNAPGNYTVTVNNSGCSATKNFVIAVTQLPIATFTYAASAYCFNSPNVTPTIVSNTGTFAATPAGLSIVPASGIINIGLSTPGIYTITNTIPASGGCSVVVASTTITVYPESDILLESGCEGTKYVVVAKPVNNSFSLATATFAWAGPNFAAIAGRANAIEAKAAGNYIVTVTTPDGCKSIETINVASVLCQIQKGISPNGDGKNDSFDLTSLGVSKLEIFNRYGTLVYDLANYTNQWVGQSSAGGELPDGTYFYVIQKADGTPGITGWIYINR